MANALVVNILGKIRLFPGINLSTAKTNYLDRQSCGSNRSSSQLHKMSQTYQYVTQPMPLP